MFRVLEKNAPQFYEQTCSQNLKIRIVFVSFTPSKKTIPPRNAKKRNLPSILKRHGISVQKRESAYHALLEVTRSGNANPKLQVPAARTVRRIMPKSFPADPNQKRYMSGSAHFILMHQTTVLPNVESGMKEIPETLKKIVATGKLFGKPSPA